MALHDAARQFEHSVRPGPLGELRKHAAAIDKGLPRTVDKAAVNAVGSDGTDIGAFEVQ